MTNKTKELLNKWDLPDRTEDRMQLTLRLDFDLYAKLHSLKNIYPNQSVNEFINGFLRQSIDDVIDILGEPKGEREEFVEEIGEVVFLSPNKAYLFQDFYSRIMKEGKDGSLLANKKVQETEVAKK